MNNLKIFFLFFVVFLMFSCMTVNLKELNISKIDVVLKNAKDQPVNSLVPDSSYKIEISVEDTEGKILPA